MLPPHGMGPGARTTYLRPCAQPLLQLLVAPADDHHLHRVSTAQHTRQMTTTCRRGAADAQHTHPSGRSASRNARSPAANPRRTAPAARPPSRTWQRSPSLASSCVTVSSSAPMPSPPPTCDAATRARAQQLGTPQPARHACPTHTASCARGRARGRTQHETATQAAAAWLAALHVYVHAGSPAALYQSVSWYSGTIGLRGLCANKAVCTSTWRGSPAGWPAARRPCPAACGAPSWAAGGG